MDAISRQDAISHPDEALEDALFSEVVQQETSSINEGNEPTAFTPDIGSADAFQQLLNTVEPTSMGNDSESVFNTESTTVASEEEQSLEQIDVTLVQPLKVNDVDGEQDTSRIEANTESIKPAEDEQSFLVEENTSSDIEEDLHVAMESLTVASSLVGERESEQSVQEIQQEQEPVVPEDTIKENNAESAKAPRKTPFYLRPLFIVGIIVSILSLLALGVVYVINDYQKGTVATQASSSSEHQSQSTPIAEPGLLEGEEGEPSQEILNPNKLFNGIDTPGDSNQEYTDIDPITQKTITKLESQISQLKSDLATEKSLREADQSKIRQLTIAQEDWQAKASALNAQITDLNRENGWLKEDATKSKQQISALNEIKSKLEVDLRTEQRISASEKESRLLAEKRYAELVNSRSTELEAMREEMASLRSTFVSTFSEKKSRDAKSMLAKLHFVNLDFDSKTGHFIKMENGKPTGKLTLSAGETLIGRGVVKNVDDYGCITFTDNETYQPLNGYCP